jgi:HEAT repeat protein
MPTDAMSGDKGIDVLIEQLGDPSRSNQALLALLFKGESAVPALAQFLRSSKLSSLPEAKLLAVEGLSALKGPEALDVLIGVASRRLSEIPDPVVRFAEETVSSHAAFALSGFSDPRALETLLCLLEGRPLVGVAEAFEKIKDPRAIPHLVSWLEHDIVAEQASRAIRAYGAMSLPLLLESLKKKHLRNGSETGMSQRRRARILEILFDLGEPAVLEDLEYLLDDPVEVVRWDAVRLFFTKGNDVQRRHAYQVGMGFLDSKDNLLRAECEELLVAHFGLGCEWIAEEINHRRIQGEKTQNYSPRETTLAILLRIFRKGNETKKLG